MRLHDELLGVLDIAFASECDRVRGHLCPTGTAIYARAFISVRKKDRENIRSQNNSDPVTQTRRTQRNGGVDNLHYCIKADDGRSQPLGVEHKCCALIIVQPL